MLQLNWPFATSVYTWTLSKMCVSFPILTLYIISTATQWGHFHILVENRACHKSCNTLLHQMRKIASENTTKEANAVEKNNSKSTLLYRH